MRVINVHKRIINQPKIKVSQLFKTLAMPQDQVWPIKSWPAMRFKDGVIIGSKGGHGQIRYTITEFDMEIISNLNSQNPKDLKVLMNCRLIALLSFLRKSSTLYPCVQLLKRVCCGFL